MKTNLVTSLICFTFISTMVAQDLPYRQIPNYPETYTAGSVAARMVDGLGFRYFWATEGLRAEDLAHKPSEGARTSEETLNHIVGLSRVVVNATLKKGNGDGQDPAEMSFEEKRKETLENLQKASEILRSASNDDMESFIIKFGPGREYPFWNNINGPIADAIWHTGQVVSFRRSSGNPFNSKVSVFSGKLRE